jgi:hypothetical protein
MWLSSQDKVVYLAFRIKPCTVIQTRETCASGTGDGWAVSVTSYGSLFMRIGVAI